jgi:hypothetical protein
MSRSLIRTGFVAAAAVLAVVAFEGVAQRAAAPGGWSAGLTSKAWAGEYTLEAKPRRRARHARRRPPQGSTAEEIARYFQLYGGFIDPAINKQSQGGPFDSGFFFDSGIGPNGGDSPYMNCGAPGPLSAIIILHNIARAGPRQGAASSL